METSSQPDVTYSPLVRHPSRPVVVWSAGSFLFAFNYLNQSFEAYRVNEHTEPIRSIDFCPIIEGAFFSNCWLVCGDDKQVIVFEDETFRLKERFLLFKRATAIRCTRQGTHLLWGDKFGELFEIAAVELKQITQQIVMNMVTHLEINKKDNAASQLYKKILERIAPDILRMISNEKINDDGIHPSTTLSLDESEDELVIPFAGHLSQITSLEINGDRSLIVSGDRDEKIRVGSLENLHITTGYGLGHTQFITSICCPKSIPTLAISASGDKSLKLWDLSAGTSSTEEGCVELSSINVKAVPSLIQFAEKEKFAIFVGENRSGFTVVPLTKENDDQKWIFESTNTQFVDLPFCPMAICSINFNMSEMQQLIGVTPFDTKCDGMTVVFWTDREGRLRVPVDIHGSRAIPLKRSWAGDQTGEAIPTATIRWWKHNREAGAIPEEIRLKKRLRHKENSIQRNSFLIDKSL